MKNILKGKHNKQAKREAQEKTKKINDNMNMSKKIGISIVFILITIGIYISTIYTAKTETFTYEAKNNMEYQVYLKPNEYYTQPYLTEDMHYIANLIQNIHIQFQQDFKSNIQINDTSTYKIEAKVNIFEKGNPNKIIFEESEIVLPETIVTNENVNENKKEQAIDIAYDKYNEKVKAFKTKYNIAADSHLKVIFTIQSEVQNDKFSAPVIINEKMEMIIPLTEQMIDIKKEYGTKNQTEEIEVATNQGLTNILRVTSYITGTIAILIIASIIIEGIKKRNQKSPYQKKIASILKNFDRLVVTVKKPMTIKPEDEVIEVENFEELVYMSDRVGKSILFMEINQNKESWFIVKAGEEIYRYILEDIR